MEMTGMAPLSLADELTGRVALVTGAGSGMGRSHALHLAGLGARVVAQDIDGERVRETAALVEAADGVCIPLAFDVADAEHGREALDEIQQSLGSIDILINNAGIFDEYTTEEIDPEIFWRMMNIHARGTFSVTKCIVDGMKAKGFGRIINISSHWGLVGHHISPHYCAAKAAILGLTKSWALEFAEWGITVNAIASGGVLTEMVMVQKNIEHTLPGRFALVPLGRYARPEEITSVVAFLVSPAAAFITGQTINVSGGEAIVGI
jgi:3-oxoacyl-[acyl-carrier protein] reductase